MMLRPSWIYPFGVLIWLSQLTVCSAQVTEPQQPSSFTSLDGKRHSLNGADRVTCLLFINIDCPVANAYHPALRQLSLDFAEQKVDFVMIHADPHLTPEQARKHATEYDIRWSVAIDPGNAVARQVQAKVTPEAILIDRAGKVVYRGRIDDRVPEYGKKRVAPTREDLRVALSELLAAKPISVPTTKAIGCVIRYSQ